MSVSRRTSRTIDVACIIGTILFLGSWLVVTNFYAVLVIGAASSFCLVTICAVCAPLQHAFDIAADYLIAILSAAGAIFAALLAIFEI